MESKQKETLLVLALLGMLFSLILSLGLHLDYKHKIELQLLENNLYTETLEDYLNYEIDLMGLELEIALLEQELEFIKTNQINSLYVSVLEQNIELLQDYIRLLENRLGN